MDKFKGKMTAESLDLKRKLVIVGIRLDCHTKELLDWAVVKVADTGDAVVAVHVCRKSDSISKEEALLEGYLEDYQGLCSEKQVALTVEVFKAKSIRKVLVMEAKNHSASVVVVGITRHTALGGWASVAKYCTKRLPPSTEVMAVHNGRIAFSRFSSHQLQGPGKDPKPSFYLTSSLISKDNQSEFGESEISEISRLSYDGIVIEGNSMGSRAEVFSRIRRRRRDSLSSLSLPVEDFTNQRPGWPLLQTASSVTRLALEARNMSVVKWVMSLPNRPLLDIAESRNEKDELEDEGPTDKVTKGQELPKDLELVLEKRSPRCEVYSYHALNIATSEFSLGNLIGKGGCNSVYKGILSEGKPVAVKILRSSKVAWKDFILEVEIITTAKHQRITPLLGLCIEDNNLISVYDFLPKGNLEENLHGGDRKKSSVLSWEIRFKIAFGIAEALNYIHNGCPKPIIHRDIKSSNILLTDELEPQLSDFGLAIWGPTAASFLTDDILVGTFGYLAPEYFMYGKVSDKIDVYAFGVVLLELLSGRKPIGLETEKGQESLILWARPKLESGDFRSILDPDLALNDKDIEAQIQRIAQAARLCLTQAARLRPKMHQILNILRGDEHEDEVSTPTSGNYNDLDNQNDNDDEVYPDLRAESHLSLAFFDIDESSTSFSSMDRSSPLSVEEYLKKTWSRSSSFE